MSANNTAAAASSATYRKSLQALGNATGIKTKSSRFPKQDFEEFVTDLPEAMKERALEWYIRGIKRGMALATDMMVDGDIEFNKDGVLEAPGKIKVKTKIKFKGGDWEAFKTTIPCKDIGFE